MTLRNIKALLERHGITEDTEIASLLLIAPAESDVLEIEHGPGGINICN